MRRGKRRASRRCARGWHAWSMPTWPLGTRVCHRCGVPNGTGPSMDQLVELYQLEAGASRSEQVNPRLAELREEVRSTVSARREGKS